MRGNYIRTSAIRKKQSKTMKRVIKSYDWETIKKKRLQTIQKNGSRIGRPKGTGKPKLPRTERLCKTCKTVMMVTETQKIKYCSRKCMYEDPDYRLLLASIDRSYMQTEAYSKSRGIKDNPAFRRYKNLVCRLSEETYVRHIELINPERHPRTLAGVEGGYQLDHKISIKRGFLDGMEPQHLAVPENLQMLPWRDNLKKSAK